MLPRAKRPHASLCLALHLISAADRVCMHAPQAYFRRATALEAKKDFEGAKKDLARASELAPEDKSVKKLMERVEAQ